MNTKDIPFEPSLHSVPELSAPAPSYPRTPVAPRSSSRSAAPPPGEDAIWVDCFYYGFYMEKSRCARVSTPFAKHRCLASHSRTYDGLACRLPAFQASLRQKQAMHKSHQHMAR